MDSERPLFIPVILGTVRSERVGPRVARYLVRKLEERGHRPTLIDPVEFALPLLDKMYKEFPPGGAPPSNHDYAREQAWKLLWQILLRPVPDETIEPPAPTPVTETDPCSTPRR